MKNGSVWVAHPGKQHSYHTALAAQKSGLLGSFHTGLYYKDSYRFLERVPLIGRAVSDQLKRRYLPGLDGGSVELHPFGELVFVSLSKLKGVDADAVIGWRNSRFSRSISRRILKDAECSAVICYNNSGALEIFKAAKAKGITCVLDQTIAHIGTVREIEQEELSLSPDFSDSLLPLPPKHSVATNSEELELADYVLAGSEFCRDSLIKNGVPGNKIVVIPYGVDTSLFIPGSREPGAKFRILFVGGIGQRKGVKYLLEAVKRLDRAGIELLMVGGVIGGGGLAGYRGLYTHVPNVPHHLLPEYFRGSDIFVFPSLVEGSAISVYEALASGLPVITTKNSGSVVQDGIDGYVVPVRDPGALAEKILKLYQDPETRKRMNENARNKALEYTWERYYSRIGSFLKEIKVRNAA